SWAYAPEALKTGYDHDPQRAERLLDEAGWTKGPDGIRVKDGRRFSFTLDTQVGYAPTANLMQRQWRQIGVEVKPRVEDFAAYGQRVRETRDFEMYLGRVGLGVDPDQTVLWGTDGSLNWGKYSNPRVDELLARGLAEPDQERRKALYLEMQNIVLDEAPAVALTFLQSTFALNKRVHNLKPNAVNTRWNVHLWWVEDGK
ncbi:MAG: ABC transporter substrate-binding protein, partial [Chloroflexota bacterium]|nr:ABC transporter substrate-binding protein [Chloroflexota bacterium]